MYNKIRSMTERYVWWNKQTISKEDRFTKKKEIGILL